MYVCVMLFARLLLFNYNKLYFNCDREGHKPNRTTFVFVVFAIFFKLTLLFLLLFLLLLLHLCFM